MRLSAFFKQNNDYMIYFMYFCALEKDRLYNEH